MGRTSVASVENDVLVGAVSVAVDVEAATDVVVATVVIATSHGGVERPLHVHCATLQLKHVCPRLQNGNVGGAPESDV